MAHRGLDERSSPVRCLRAVTEREAVYLFAKYEGLLLDPVYTGRAAAGMIDLIRTKFFKKDETVLFLYTGGQPALFADEYANKVW